MSTRTFTAHVDIHHGRSLDWAAAAMQALAQDHADVGRTVAKFRENIELRLPGIMDSSDLAVTVERPWKLGTSIDRPAKLTVTAGGKVACWVTMVVH